MKFLNFTKIFEIPKKAPFWVIDHLQENKSRIFPTANEVWHMTKNKTFVLFLYILGKLDTCT